MAIGRTFKEASMKGVRSLELGKSGLLFGEGDPTRTMRRLKKRLAVPNDWRMLGAVPALERGWSVEHFARHHQDRFVVPASVRRDRRAETGRGADGSFKGLKPEQLRSLKRPASATPSRRVGDDGARAETSPPAARATRSSRSTSCIDTCAAEFESFTPISTVRTSRCAKQPQRKIESDDPRQRPESNRPGDRVRLLLGSAPSRCAAGRRRDGRWSTANPETVSTDFDASDRLYFEPLTLRVSRRSCETRMAIDSGDMPPMIVQFGGQTAINLAKPLSDAGGTILGSSLDSIDLAEDRERFEAFLNG